MFYEILSENVDRFILPVFFLTLNKLLASLKSREVFIPLLCKTRRDIIRLTCPKI